MKALPSTQNDEFDKKHWRRYQVGCLTPDPTRRARISSNFAKQVGESRERRGFDGSRLFEAERQTPMANNLKAIQAEFEKRKGFASSGCRQRGIWSALFLLLKGAVGAA